MNIQLWRLYSICEAGSKDDILTKLKDSIAATKILVDSFGKGTFNQTLIARAQKALMQVCSTTIEKILFG